MRNLSIDNAIKYADIFSENEIDRDLMIQALEFFREDEPSMIEVDTNPILHYTIAIGGVWASIKSQQKTKLSFSMMVWEKDEEFFDQEFRIGSSKDYGDFDPFRKYRDLEPRYPVYRNRGASFSSPEEGFKVSEIKDELSKYLDVVREKIDSLKS